MPDSDADFESSTKDEAMTFKRTNRHGFLLGFIDFFTAGLFFLLYMPLGGLQDELAYILNRKMIAVLEGLPPRHPDAVHLPTGVDGADRGRTESQCSGDGCSGPTHVLVAYVWVEHLWPPAVWTGCRHAQVFQHTKQSRGCDEP